MPVDPQAFNAARVESMLHLAFEAAQQGDPDQPLPEDVRAQIAAIAEMTPEDFDGMEDEEGDSEEYAEDEGDYPEPDVDDSGGPPDADKDDRTFSAVFEMVEDPEECDPDSEEYPLFKGLRGR